MTTFDTKAGKDTGRGSAQSTTKPAAGVVYNFSFSVIDADGVAVWSVYGADKKRVVKRGRKALRDLYGVHISQSEQRMKEYSGQDKRSKIQFAFQTSNERKIAS